MGAVVKLVRPEPATKREPWTLEDHADFINRQFDVASKGETRSLGARIKAGRALIEVRKLVPPGEWGKWCDKNINRSRSDIFKVMKMAGCADPEAALVDERGKAASRMRRVREEVAANVANVRNIDGAERPIGRIEVFATGEPDLSRPDITLFPDAVDALVSAYVALSVEQRARFRAEIQLIEG